MKKINIETITKHFNGVALVAQNGRQTQMSVEGYADYEQGIKHSANSKFLICSISKMFISVAINQLGEKGILDKNDLLSKYMPDFFSEYPITLYHLLTHTSGIPNYIMYRKQLSFDTPHTTEEILKVVKDKPLQFSPGAKWRYSNTGYYVLAMIIEQLTGMSYEDYIRENILKPSQMKDTTLVTNHPKNIVKPHTKGKCIVPIHESLLFGAGDVVSTAKDLYLFGKALMEGKLVALETLRQMSQPVFSNKKMKYGEGLFVNEHFGTLQIGHSGSMPGYSTQLSIYPEKKLISVVLTNNSRMIHPLTYVDCNGKYIDACLAEQVLDKKVGVIKKAYL